MKHLHFAIAMWLVVLFSVSAQATITVNGIGLEAYTYAGNSGMSDTKSFSGTSIPTVPDPATLDVNTTGISEEAYSNNTIDWSVTGLQTILSFDMVHKTGDGVFGSGAGTTIMLQPFRPLSFTASADAVYELSGYYNMTNVVANIGSFHQYANFVDVADAGNPLYFENKIPGNQLLDSSVSLALGDGQFFANSQGSLTGNLIAGHTYELTFTNDIQRAGSFEQFVSAVGNVTLKIGVVPEPSAFAICSVLGLVIVSRRR